jgi:hypothetical protein
MMSYPGDEIGRSAFEVMMRRQWWPSYEEDGWRLDDLNASCAELAEWALAHPFPDPFTALVEADKWYRENLDGKRQPYPGHRLERVP